MRKAKVNSRRNPLRVYADNSEVTNAVLIEHLGWSTAKFYRLMLPTSYPKIEDQETMERVLGIPVTDWLDWRETYKKAIR